MDYREDRIGQQIDEIIQSAVLSQGGFRFITKEMREVLEEAVSQRLKLDTSGGNLLIPLDDVVDAVDEILNLLSRTQGRA